ncbi:chloride channel protein [Actinomycetospora sp. NBRC 106378]|uniref:chloride channel protein n=1 Tax=Actinomycetospora sp. NBRC 106378 TaxID=3032208 RepID=UPI0024A332A6|nr:chloride channel protein [Actinomycetospora sp. NBRC 106378]GLZ54080.1 voltage-gated chloride channel [Actinomycetospora sp. NBRC 106378]
MQQPNAPEGHRGLITLGPRFWVVVLLTGVGAGFAGGALTLLLYLVQHTAFGYTEESFLQGVEQAPWWRRLGVLALAGLVAGLGWWLLRGPVSRRLGRSSGVSESVWSERGRMGFIRTALDAVLQIVIVGMGASLGREGAPREVAAALGSGLSELAGLSSAQQRTIIACGAGAGLAAVYNVPFGGALFTLEVLLGSLALPMVLPAIVTSVLAAVCAWIVIGDRPVYLFASLPTSGSVIVFAVLVAPVAAVAAVGFVHLVGWARRGRPTAWRLPLATTAVFTAIGALAIPFPELLGNGKGPVQLVLDGGGSLGLLVVLALLKPLITAASLRSGATGGLFTPTLATGALLGAVLGHLWVLVWAGSPLGAYALVGGAAFLAASLQAPLSTVVLLLELTHVGQGMLVPLALAATLGTLVARLLERRSTYTAGLEDDLPGAPDPLAPDPERGQVDARRK